ncbi:MAG: pyruvate kinase [Bacteroidales bacterium]|jgi:pyruvate kinase
MSKKTKIVATIGPSSQTLPQMKELLSAGVNVFRFNMKHNDVSWHEERIARADEAASSLGLSAGILIDLQGPEIRIETKNKAEIEVEKGETVIFGRDFESEKIQVAIPHPEVFELLKTGDSLLIDDGFLEFEIVRKIRGTFEAIARDHYTIKNRKGLNLPGKNIELPSLIASDLLKLDMATRSKVDFVALSFCRSKKDIEILRAELTKRNLEVGIVAKIESQEALDNLDEIVGEADAVMVARGDLGIEVPIEQLASWQKMMIAKCRKAKKPVIVATQMLQSMTENPRPTRAEATDVSNAVWDGTDAVMLSGETASGIYPLQAAEAMARIAKFNEGAAIVKELFEEAEDNTQAVAAAAYRMVHEQHKLEIKAIVVFTETGYTARAISAFRPNVPILAVTDSSKTADRMAMSFGVTSFITTFPEGNFSMTAEVVKKLIASKLVSRGDTVVAVHGQHFNKPNLTNALELVRL